MERTHDTSELVVQLGRVGGASGDDERRARLVDEDRVHLVDDREEVCLLELGPVTALHLLFASHDHVVAQVVEPEFVVGAVGDVAVVLAALLVGRRVVGDDRPDLQAEKAVEPAHPLGVEPGEVVVDGDEVNAASGEGVEIAGQRRDERLALAGLHFRDPTEVERGAAHDLDVEVALAQYPLAGLAHGREGVGQEVVERVGDEVELVLAVACTGLGPVDASAELGGARHELLVAQALDLGLERRDERNDGLYGLEPLALPRVEKLLEDAHAGRECTGAERARLRRSPRV